MCVPMLTCQLCQSKKYKVAVVTELKWQERNQGRVREGFESRKLKPTSKFLVLCGDGLKQNGSSDVDLRGYN